LASFDYDVVIIGSGFGGSVAALRAAEKGYRVGVMESSRRWKDEDIPKTQWDGLATDAFRTLGPGDGVPDDFVVPYYLDDRKLRISVAHVGHRLYAFDDLCPCTPDACPLSGGLLTGTTIMCQCHGSRFDITTGAVIRGPATEPLHVYEVQVVGGSIRLRLSRAVTDAVD
jgi:3-phenylpropionate/trans-cinnamate dioxygenase ferredoxin component